MAHALFSKFQFRGELPASPNGNPNEPKHLPVPFPYSRRNRKALTLDAPRREAPPYLKNIIYVYVIIEKIIFKL